MVFLPSLDATSCLMDAIDFSRTSTKLFFLVTTRNFPCTLLATADFIIIHHLPLVLYDGIHSDLLSVPKIKFIFIKVNIKHLSIPSGRPLDGSRRFPCPD